MAGWCFGRKKEDVKPLKILIITGTLWPRVWNNANLLSKLLPYLSEKHEIELLSAAFGEKSSILPKQFFGLPVHWATDERKGFMRNVLASKSVLSKDRGYTGQFGAELIASAARELKEQFPYEAVLSTMQPYNCALASSKISNVHRFLYLMDPPDITLENQSQSPTQIHMKQLLQNQDLIFTTPFISDALKKVNYLESDKLVQVSFPHITPAVLRPTEQDVTMDPDHIHLLFCGALFPSVRDPQFFLKILSRLDERFCVTFMGRNCEEFWRTSAIKTKAQVRAFPPLPYQAAINAMNHADILINIGNNMHVHMPSKTLDYINTGKPIINFHKFADCPTLYYTSRYPLCLNIQEKEKLSSECFDRFLDFCLTNRNTKLPRTDIVRNFTDCCPEHIANIILDRIDLYC